MIKNKKYNRVFLLYVLLPSFLLGMQRGKQIINPKSIPKQFPKGPTRPQPVIYTLPSTEPITTAPSMGTPGNVSPGGQSPLQPSPWFVSPSHIKPSIATIPVEKKLLEYNRIIKDAQKLGLDIKQVEADLEWIKTTHDITSEIAKRFGQLEEIIEKIKIPIPEKQEPLKIQTPEEKAIEELLQDIVTAQENNRGVVIVHRDATQFIDYIKQLAQDNGVKIVPDEWVSITRFGKEIFKFKQLFDGTIEYLKSGDEDGLVNIVNPNTTYWGDYTIVPKIDTLVQPKPTAVDLKQTQISLQNRIKKNIEIAEKEKKAQMESEAAQQKAAEEQAKLSEEKLHKEVDELYEQLDKDSTHLEELAKELLAQEQEQKQLEFQQEKVVNKQEQEKLMEKIRQNEDKQEELERKIEKIKQAKEQALQEIDKKNSAAEMAHDQEIEAWKARHELESEQRQKALEKINSEVLQAKREVLEAEQTARQSKEKLEEVLLNLQQTETNLQAKQQSLAGDAQAIEQLEHKLGELGNKVTTIQQERASAQSQFAEQQKQIDMQTTAELEQVKQDSAKKIQDITVNLQQSKEFIHKTAAEQVAELDAETTKIQEEALIKQQSIAKAKNDRLARIAQKYDEALRLMEADMQQFMQQQQLKTVEKITQPQQTEPLKIEEPIKIAEPVAEEINKGEEKPIIPKESEATITTGQKQSLQETVESPQKTIPEEVGKEVKEKPVEEPIEKVEIKEEKKEEVKPEELPQIKKQEQVEGGGAGDASPEMQKEEGIKEEKEEEKQPPMQPLSSLTPPEIIAPQEANRAEVKQEVTPEVKPIITKKPKKEIASTIPEKEYQPTWPETPSPKSATSSAAVPAGSGQSSSPIKTQIPTRAAERPLQPFKPSISSGGGGYSPATSVSSPGAIGRTTPYTQRIDLGIRVPEKVVTAPQEIKIEKSAPPQPQVWWEKFLPTWVVQRLGRKDRAITKKPTIEKPGSTVVLEKENIKSAEQKEVSIIETIVEVVKKPIINVINYIRGLFGFA